MPRTRGRSRRPAGNTRTGRKPHWPSVPEDDGRRSGHAETGLGRIAGGIAAAVRTAARRGRDRNGDRCRPEVYPQGRSLALGLAPGLATRRPRRTTAEEHGHDSGSDFGCLLFLRKNNSLRGHCSMKLTAETLANTAEMQQQGWQAILDNFGRYVEGKG